MTSSTALGILKDQRVATPTTSSTKSTDTLGTGVVGEDAGKDVGHDDRRLMKVKYQ